MALKPPNKRQIALIRRAVKKYDSQEDFAKTIGATRALVSMWLCGTRVAGRWCLPLEKHHGISRSAIRPDLYPLEEN